MSSGKWDGGRATATKPHFAYRTATRTKDKSKFTLVEAVVTWVDQEDQPHDIRYGVGGDEYVMIKAECSDDADEANEGPSIAHRDPTLVYKPRLDSEFGQLLTSLFTNGYPESKFEAGDFTVIEGLDADVVPVPHKKGEDDKYPMMLVSHIYGGGGMKGSGKATAGGAASAAASSRPKRGAAAANDDDDDKPVAKKGTKVSADADIEATPAQVKRARQMVIDIATETDGVTTSSDVIRGSAKELRGDDDRPAIMELFGDDEWLGSQAKWWKYSPKSTKITLVE